MVTEHGHGCYGAVCVLEGKQQAVGSLRVPHCVCDTLPSLCTKCSPRRTEQTSALGLPRV